MHHLLTTIRNLNIFDLMLNQSSKSTTFLHYILVKLLTLGEFDSQRVNFYIVFIYCYLILHTAHQIKNNLRFLFVLIIE